MIIEESTLEYLEKLKCYLLGFEGSVYHLDYGNILGDGGGPHRSHSTAPPDPVPSSWSALSGHHGQELPEGQQHAVRGRTDDGCGDREVGPPQENRSCCPASCGIQAKVVSGGALEK